MDPRDGDGMIKSFLILMLMTTQLLAGSGGSVYLCIRNDGSFCCLNVGPASGTCRELSVTSRDDQVAQIAENSSGCRCGCCGDESASQTADDQPAAPTSELSDLSGTPCGCIHILLSHDQPSARPAKALAASDVEQFCQIASDLTSVAQTGGANPDWHSLGQRFRPPAVRSQTLTVLSWVLIQC